VEKFKIDLTWIPSDIGAGTEYGLFWEAIVDGRSEDFAGPYGYDASGRLMVPEKEIERANAHIASQAAEIERLKAKVARLEDELTETLYPGEKNLER
jgi:dsDNA-specific endonuclease/ATPase MutS2